VPEPSACRHAHSFFIQDQRSHGLVSQSGSYPCPSVAGISRNQDLAVSRADVNDADPGRMGSYYCDLLPDHILADEPPIVSGIHRAIYPALSESKDHAVIYRVDDELLNRLIIQVGAAILPRLPSILRVENTAL
jgi:hypothetical protein